MEYLIIKALHIIFMVSYFAGLFYGVRLFVYYKDTDDFENPKADILRRQYIYMASRLWNIITVPAGVIMALTGLTMIYLNEDLLQQSWFHLKLFFLGLLGIYHYWTWQQTKQLKILDGAELKVKNLLLRQANEIATLLLFLIVFTVVLKYYAVEYGWQLLGGFIILMIVIMGIVKLVNKNKK